MVTSARSTLLQGLLAHAGRARKGVENEKSAFTRIL